MTARYDSSPSSLRALRDRLTAVAKRKGVFGRLQQHVGVLVVAQFMNRASDGEGAPMLLVKGGADGWEGFTAVFTVPVPFEVEP